MALSTSGVLRNFTAADFTDFEAAPVGAPMPQGATAKRAAASEDDAAESDDES
jgi:hypothetical protein